MGETDDRRFEFIVPEGWARRTAWSIVRYGFLPPASWPWVLIEAVGVLCLVIRASGGARYGGLELLGFVCLLVPPVLIALVGLRTQRAIARSLPVGSVLTTEFGAESFTVTGPKVSSTVEYSVYSRLVPRGRLVGLTAAGRRHPRAYYAAELFPEEIRSRFGAGSA